MQEAINEPPPVGRIPVMIGGAGEKKTLRLVAQYADVSNLTSSVDELPRKLDALAAHCERVGRDRAEIKVTQALNVCIAETHDEAYADMRTFLADRGLDIEAMDEATRAQILSLVVWGDPDEVGERLADVLSRGVDGVTCSLPANGHVPGRVELLGKVGTAALRG